FMKEMPVFKSRLVGLMVLFVLLLGIVPLQAQEPVTISIGLPPIFEDLLKPSIEDFMVANPDIIVEIVTADTPSYTPGDDIEVYLDEMAEYARSADVLTGQDAFNVIATRAGFFLDLSPLVNAGSSLNVDEFFPSMWQSYQWDGSIWAIPLAGDVVGLVYEVEAFDNAGLAYPNERWTLDDLVIAAEQLAVYGEGNIVEEAPVTNFADSGFVAVAALDNPLYDTFQFDGIPAFDNPQLEPAIEVWSDLQADGFVAIPEGLEFSPIVFAPSIVTALVAFSGSDAEYAFTTLPGGSVGLQPLGAGISAGSAQPEAAYRLIKYMTEEESVFTSIIGQPIPARRTLVGAEADNALFALELPEELFEQVIEFAETAVPYSQTLFSEYVSQAASNVLANDTDVATALSEMASQALDDLQAANNRRGTDVVTVTQDDNTIVGSGDVTLTFGLVGFGPIANREGWDATIADFIQRNPQMASIELERLSFLSGDNSLSDYHEKVDCFYQPSRLDTNEDLTLLLPIDPLLAADPNLSLDDFVGNTVELLSQNGVTYGMPLHVAPEVLFYNVDLFNAAGAFLPYQGWTVNDFEQALRTLRFDANDPAAFESQTGGTYTLSLVAAYGGLPMDYRTSPPTVDFTTEANVNAIRQVLDLAKDGYINYSPLAAGGGPGGGGDDVSLRKSSHVY
ncbi:MAG: extracellular solute-binding protein, partial [Anaerolineae bacterium]|nr:extracellular solute-binding protein [Anaerolineae bacterium]